MQKKLVVLQIKYGESNTVTVKASSGSETYTKKITSLTPGTSYTFTINTYVQNSDGSDILSQNSKETGGTTIPLPPTDVTLQRSPDKSTTELLASWTASITNDEKVTYKVRLMKVKSGENSKIENKTASAKSSHSFSQLVPGGCYQVYVWSEAGDNTDNQQVKSVEVKNDPPTYTTDLGEFVPPFNFKESDMDALL
ncbi:hypothetical protein LSH36_2079g00005 [Paralvinella palmiformis]|uniref:Fibronectin type-III domain-containing protein n=1 Tax=Paralvinella palmiformis TaxID=53620 RepID=A0AAD9MM83_9ANNE|nr:hypothetical protein LSH36_2079g00005 [Paralvinella palmiformis]